MNQDMFIQECEKFREKKGFGVDFELNVEFPTLCNWLGVKRVTEPNRTTGLYRTEPMEISDNCGTGFYRVAEPNYLAYFLGIFFLKSN